MSRENFAYKTVQKMLDEIESGRQFARGLKGRCFREAFFEDLEKLTLLNSANRLLGTNSSGGRQIQLPVTRRYPMAIAASISLLLVALYFSIRLFLPNNIQTAQGEFKTIELPDHSRISLNAESSVSYNPVSWYWDRSVNLNGEAFFEVEKGSDFVVHTNSGEVRVLGTSFNVLQRKGRFKVDCKTGVVEVKSQGGKLTLTRDQSAHIDPLNGRLVRNEDKNNYVATWRKGYFNFDGERLENVIEEFERQYAVNIELKTNENYLFTGYFPISNLDSSLETVCSAFGLEYKIRTNSDNSREIIIQ